MITVKKSFSIFTACVLVSYLGVRVVSYLTPDTFAVWNGRFHDQFFRSRYHRQGPLKTHPDIVHVDIDNASYEVLGRELLMRRSTYAKIINVLRQSGCAAILSDIAFWGATDREDDSALVDAAASCPGFYLPLIVNMNWSQATTNSHVSGTTIAQKYCMKVAVRNKGTIPVIGGYRPSFDILDEVVSGGGHITSPPEQDGIHRRFNLLIGYGDSFVPAIAFRLACDWLGVEDGDIVLDAGNSITLRNIRLALGNVRDVNIPIDEKGRAIINFVGPWGTGFPHYSVHKLLEAAEDEDELDSLTEALDGSIAVLSDVSAVAQDIGAVPVEEEYPKAGFHSSVLNSILLQNFLRDAHWREEAMRDGCVVVLALVAAYLLGAILYAVAMLVLLIGNYGLGMRFFMESGVLLSVVEISIFLVISMLAVVVAKYLLSEMEKARLRRRFESYMAPGVLAKVLESPSLIANFQRKIVTTMFTDIAGFTKWCSTQTPSEIHRTLNEYFDEMTRIVFKYEGTVDKYIGDGMMVFFGDPISQDDHALRAVRAGIEMQIKACEIRVRWIGEGRLDLKIRVGINTGDVAVGSMGSAMRMDYTALGTNVNIAQRLESNAPIGGVLISRSTKDAVGDAVPTKSCGFITVKGIAEKMEVFEVVLPNNPI
ncbi:MAG: adenylate/guanylate cyclase domain-containing protein [Lentisphaerae bacterium]|nr:adenylate/guanylate cyclase domain-containing protein [Lentisphaerota bacterium]